MLLIPPARLKRCDALSADPKERAKGLAAVCWRENPRPTMNKPEIKNPKELYAAAGINNKVPRAEMDNPNAIPFW